MKDDVATRPDERDVDEPTPTPAPTPKDIPEDQSEMTKRDDETVAPTRRLII
jgi:hypothetical protein